MQRFVITPLMNGTARFRPYEPEHVLIQHSGWTFTVDAASAVAAADRMFSIGNRMTVDVNLKSWPSSL